MAYQIIDPSLLEKGTSVNTFPASPKHASLSKSVLSQTYHHEKPLDHTFLGDNCIFDLDLGDVATRRVVDISDALEHGHSQYSYPWVSREAAPAYVYPVPFNQRHAHLEPNPPLGASSDDQNVLEYLTEDAREPWSPLQVGNDVHNIGPRLNTWPYPTYLGGPMQDRQTIPIGMPFPGQTRLRSIDTRRGDTMAAEANHPGRTRPIQSVHERPLPNGFPMTFGGDSMPTETQTYPSWQMAPFDQVLSENCHLQQDAGCAEVPSYYGEAGAEQNGNPSYISGVEAPCYDWPVFSMDDEEEFKAGQDIGPQRTSQYEASHSQVLPTHDDLAFCGNIHILAEDSSRLNHSWPHYIDSEARRCAKGSLGQNVAFHNMLHTQKRSRRITTSAFERPPGTGPLRLSVHEIQKTPFVPSRTGLAAGASRRKGPLTQKQRTAAAANRKNKSVCIRCRQNKISCDRKDDGWPCSRCLDLGKARVWEQPCTKAHFLEIVESGTLNYISQRAINHFTLDQTRRVRLELPETFDLQSLVSLVDHRRGRYNIRARQASKSLYVLDLNQCFDYLSNIRKTQSQSQNNLRGFIDHDILKADAWLGCVTECDPMTSILSLLSQWNNMPSRASYDFVAVDGSSLDLPMNVEDPDGQENIMIAAQLSRIVCRKLEVAGYETLQTVLNNWSKDPPSDQVLFIRQLGQVLLTLRWRVSWWELLGDGGATQDIGKERFEYRVTNLCRVLYFYYCNVKKKLPAFADPKGLEGVWSSYADASSIYDDFPKDESIDGFDQWMQRGKELIVEAGVVQRMSLS